MKKKLLFKLGIPLIKNEVKKLEKRKTSLEKELAEVNQELSEYKEVLDKAENQKVY